MTFEQSLDGMMEGPRKDDLGRVNSLCKGPGAVGLGASRVLEEQPRGGVSRARGNRGKRRVGQCWS